MKRLLYRLRRFIVNKLSSDQKIKFLRDQGMIIGDDCHIETLAFVAEPYLIELGNHVAIANGTTFITHDAGVRCFRNEFPVDDVFGEIKVGDNVFIGMNCTILPNTEIGRNCIIGAGSVVRGKFPDNSVIIGNPAKVLMNINIQRLLYKTNPGRLPTEKMTDPEKKPIVLKQFKNREMN